MHYIYIIQHQADHRIYVGQSTNVKRRWRTHIHSANLVANGKTSTGTIYISRAMAKYGTENFSITTIESWETQEEIDNAEIFWIGFFRSRHNGCGFNIAPGGAGPGTGPDHPNYGKPAPNRLFTYDQEQVICFRYTNEKLTITKLAQLYDCDQSTIHKMLQRNNIKILGNKVFSKGRHHSPATEFKKGQETHNKRFTIEQELEICKEYRNKKLTCPQIAKKYNCNKSIIQRLLKRHNTSIRSRTNLTESDKVQIREEFLSNSSRALARKYSVNKSTILRICK